MVRPFWFARTEIFQNKRNVSRGSPKFPNGISERKMCLPFAIPNQFLAIRHFFICVTWDKSTWLLLRVLFSTVQELRSWFWSFESTIWTQRLRKTVPQPHKNQQFSSDLSSWKLQWLILSGILHLPHNREAARSNYSSIEAPIISFNTTISAAILKMSKSPWPLSVSWVCCSNGTRHPTPNGNFQYGNFAFHLHKPSTNRFLHVNGKQPLRFSGNKIHCSPKGPVIKWFVI